MYIGKDPFIHSNFRVRVRNQSDADSWFRLPSSCDRMSVKGMDKSELRRYWQIDRFLEIRCTIP
jgi:hypothetical protein